MLSIGKLAAGQEGYYEQQVAGGEEDYYSMRGEAPGRWVGGVRDELGLSGEVGGGQLRAMLGGRDPGSGEVLRGRELEVTGFDLTFSAPKSVSVLFGVTGLRPAR